MAKRKEQKIDMHEFFRLMKRWAFYVTCVIMEEGCMGRSEAMKQSYLARDLLVNLGRGEVRFVYEKQDGTLREARGTLCHGISEAFDNYKYKTEMPDKDYEIGLVFSYWDLDREAFRSFSADKVKKIIEVTIKQNT